MVTSNHRKSREISARGSTSVARRKFHFTREHIVRLPAPTNGQRSYYYDAKVRGLAMAITPLGKKTFILYRKVAGRPERITIGPFLDLSIEQARKRAEELNAAIATGQNPGDKRRSVRDEWTLGELFAQYLEQHAKVHKKTWRDDVGLFNLHFHEWRFRKLSSIRKMDVVTLHAKIGRTRGNYAGNRAIELLSTIFNRAREWDWKGENPAARVKPFREEKRDRFLGPEELPQFFKALDEELNETIRDYIALSLMTGARRSNVQEMRWSEINWHSATWKIPETKSGQPQTITLSPAAIRILNERKTNATSEWVFPGRGRSGHLMEPKEAWKRICARAGLKDLRLHDLRRTLGSWQAAAGTSLPIIGKSLGHSSLSATQIYARLDLDPVRVSVNRAVDAMLIAGGLQAPALLKAGEDQ
jgi:integrase